MHKNITIPSAEKIREDIRHRVTELRALRKLLRLAEAAEAALQRKAARGMQRRTNDVGGA
jgi:hypothetical protein